MNDTRPPYPDSLGPRARPPTEWQWGEFTTTDGRRLRYGYVMPSGEVKGVVVGLHGLSEYTEKYFEVAHDMRDRQLGFFMMDWTAQGRSARLLANPQMRHSRGFGGDVDDLHVFIQQHVKKTAGAAPLVMLAHSMGGNIGLRYLAQNPGVFSCAAFSAPMTGIYALRKMPSWLRLLLTGFFNLTASRAYVFGGHDWTPDTRAGQAGTFLSSDPVRGRVHDDWYIYDPQLQVGSVTFGWLYQAVISCLALGKRDYLRNITIPCLFGLAGRDVLIDNAMTGKLASLLPAATILELPESQHEILMEQDDIRSRFLAAFDALLRSSSIS